MPRCPPSQQKTYDCLVCNFEYANEFEAEQCSLMPCEDKIFEVGDMVRLHCDHRCKTPKLAEEMLPCVGHVAEVLGPVPPARDYENEHIKIPERLNTHVYIYTVHLECERCQKDIIIHCYLPEISPAVLH